MYNRSALLVTLLATTGLLASGTVPIGQVSGSQGPMPTLPVCITPGEGGDVNQWCHEIHAPVVDYQGGSGDIRDAIAGRRAVVAGSKGGTQGLANLLSWNGARNTFGEGIISINSALLLATEMMTWPTDLAGRKVPIVFLMHPDEQGMLGNDLDVPGLVQYLPGVPDLEDFRSTRINHNLLSQHGPACIVHMPAGTGHVLSRQQVEDVLPPILQALTALFDSLEDTDPASGITSDDLRGVVESMTGLPTSLVPLPSGGQPSQYVLSDGEADPFANLPSSRAISRRLRASQR